MREYEYYEVKKDSTLDDVMICPKCKSDNVSSYSTDEIEFSYTGTGHYYIDCHCNKCNNRFRLYTEFAYAITKAYAEK